MPQLIALGLVGILGYYCWKKLKSEMARINEETRAQEKKMGRSRAKAPDTLKQDPKTGVYRLDDE